MNDKELDEEVEKIYQDRTIFGTGFYEINDDGIRHVPYARAIREAQDPDGPLWQTLWPTTPDGGRL